MLQRKVSELAEAQEQLSKQKRDYQATVAAATEEGVAAATADWKSTLAVTAPPERPPKGEAWKCFFAQNRSVDNTKHGYVSLHRQRCQSEVQQHVFFKVS